MDSTENTPAEAIKTDKTQEISTPSIDQQSLEAMVAALRGHEAAKDLNQEILEDTCIEAFAEGKLSDFSWLEQKLSEVLGEEVSLDTDEIAGSEVEGLNIASTQNEHLDKIIISEPSSFETEEEFKEIIRLHEVWMSSVLTPRKDITGGRANFKGADLSGYDLTGLNLSCADFRNCNLTGAKLEKTNLSNAWLQGAQLQGASLKGAKLKRAKLEGADLTEADITNAVFEGAHIARTKGLEEIKETKTETTSEGQDTTTEA